MKSTKFIFIIFCFFNSSNNSEKLLKNKRDSNLIDSFLQVVITTHGSVTSSGLALNNKVYFGSYDCKVYEYDPETESQKIVLTTGGRIISSGVVLNNKLYFGSGGSDKSVYEYEILELIEQDIINMKEQIKRGLYLYYNKKENHSSSPRPISNINLDNLIVISDLVINDNQKMNHII